LTASNLSWISLPRTLGPVRGFISIKKKQRPRWRTFARKITSPIRPVSICYVYTLTLSHNYPHPRSDALKLDLYELVYFVRPDNKEGGGVGTETEIKRFKDKARCMKTFRGHNQLRRRCLLTREIYSQVEVNDLGVTTTDIWRVRSCRPRLRRDQIVRGLLTLPGVSLNLARQLTKRIPRTEYPASIESVLCEKLLS